MPLVPEKTRRELCAFAELLAGQNPEGMWYKEKSELIAAVVTCQATHFLSSFHGKSITASLTRAVNWLASPAVSTSEYTYWRYIPILEAGAPPADLEASMNHLKEKIDAKIKHHEDTPLYEYYVLCRLRHGGLDPNAKQIVDDCVKELTALPNDWKPEKLCFKLTVAVLSGVDIADNIVQTAIDRLTALSTFKSDRRQWHSLVATAYILINLLQIQRHFGKTSIVGNKLEKILNETTRFLVQRWDCKDFYSEPLAGGDFGDTHYNKIIVARALVEALDSQEPRWREPHLSELAAPKVIQNQPKLSTLSNFDKPNNNPWKTGSFYVVALISIVVMFVIVWKITSSCLIAVSSIFVGIIAIAAIGAFQLKNDKQLKDETFLKLMGKVLTAPIDFFKQNKEGE